MKSWNCTVDMPADSVCFVKAQMFVLMLLTYLVINAGGIVMFHLLSQHLQLLGQLLYQW